MTTKILVLVDLPRFILLLGQRHDSVGVEPLICDVEFGALLADKSFDNNRLRAEFAKRGAITVIPPKAGRSHSIPYSFEMYKCRHLVENVLCKFKKFWRIATRYEKTEKSFSVMIHLIGSTIAIR